jgi:hypothetical protein
MSNVSSTQDAASRLASQSDAIGRLAQDSGGFAAVVAAFESEDADAFRWVLDRLEMLPYCELICEWVRIKFGVLRCREVCGIPVEKGETPSLQQFARAIVHLASNEKLLRQVVDSVACGDGEEYRAAIAELKLNDFCYLLCHWVYSVIYHRVCHVVCSPDRLLLGDAVSEIQAAAKEISSIVKNEKAFDAIGKAATTLNCETLRSAIDQFGIASQCRFICGLICSWRHVWVCRELCALRTPVLTGSYGIEEARNFALASRQLVSQPRALADLVSAVQTRNAQAYSAIIGRFGLEPYCYQICAWVGSVTCHAFCYCVCPPPGEVLTMFTEVGCYKVGPPYPNDFNANGTTVSGSLAFTGTIPLRGDIPDGTAPQALEYRFTYQDCSGVSPNPNPVVAITGTMIPPTQIGQLQFQFWNGLFWVAASVPFWVNQPSPALGTVAIAQDGVPPLNVPVNIVPDSNGWIQIPRFSSNAQGATGLFTPLTAEGLILLDTTQLTLETFDLTGATLGFPKLTAGETVPPQALSKKPLFQINFECRTVSTLTPVSSNSLNAIALSNTSYSYIRHPEWPGVAGIGFGNGSTVTFAGNLTAPILPSTVTVTAGAVTGTDNGAGVISGAGISGTINYASGAISVTFTTAPASGILVGATGETISTSQVMVLSLDILELDSGGGCTRLDDIIHLLYTSYHPYLGSCQVFLQGPGVGAMTTPPGGSITLPIQPNQGQVIGTGDGATTNFAGTLTTPVLPGSVLINAGALTATDNASGIISGGGISGTVTYASGAISVTFTTAPAAGVQVLVDYNTNDSSGVAGTPFDMTGLPPCGYIAWLQATLNLTGGPDFTCGGVYGVFQDYIPFCTVSGS